MPHKDGGVRDLRIPLIADKNMEITKKFGVLNEDEGTAYRYVYLNTKTALDCFCSLLERCLLLTIKAFSDRLLLTIV